MHEMIGDYRLDPPEGDHVELTAKWTDGRYELDVSENWFEMKCPDCGDHACGVITFGYLYTEKRTAFEIDWDEDGHCPNVECDAKFPEKFMGYPTGGDALFGS